jgi:hypothetical protein
MRRNQPDAAWDATIGIRIPGGHSTLLIEPDEIERYTADPDGYAAECCGLSKFDYLQWLDLDGAPLCGHRTAGGNLCRHIISRVQMNAAEWKAVHRVGRCPTHGGPKKHARPWDQ